MRPGFGFSRRAALAPLAAAALGACSPTAILNALSPGSGVEVRTGLAYAPGDRGGIDVYAPAGARGAPVVVFIYGGSWDSGSRDMYRFVGAPLAAAGVVCMVPDYRVYPEVRFPAFMEDAAAAVAWARAHAAEHGGDPNRMLLMGHSAGAHIAVLLALDRRFLGRVGVVPGHDLRGVIGLAGPYDFLPLTDPTVQAIFGPEADWPAGQPITYVAPGAPPMLLATGDSDRTVRPGNTTRLAARLREAGNAVEERLYPGVSHVEIIGAFSGALSFLAPVRQDVLRYVAERTGTPTARSGGA
jgi:acetyl esterase/lipase